MHRQSLFMHIYGALHRLERQGVPWLRACGLVSDRPGSSLGSSNYELKILFFFFLNYLLFLKFILEGRGAEGGRENLK